MFNTIITTVKTLLRRPSTWVWGALFPIALSTMFMFMFANLSSDGTVDPVPVAVIADEAWDASTFKDVATSLAKESDNQLLEIHECDDAADANRVLKAGEVAGIYTVDDAGAPKLTLLSSYDSSRASTVLTDRSILETVASSYTQNAELMRQIAQDNPAALADPEAARSVARGRYPPRKPDAHHARWHGHLLLRALWPGRDDVCRVCRLECRRPTAQSVGPWCASLCGRPFQDGIAGRHLYRIVAGFL